MTITVCGRFIVECYKKRFNEHNVNREAWMYVISTIELIGYIVSFTLGCKGLFDGSYPTKLCMAMVITPMVLMGIPAIGTGTMLTIHLIQEARWFTRDDDWFYD